MCREVHRFTDHISIILLVVYMKELCTSDWLKRSGYSFNTSKVVTWVQTTNTVLMLSKFGLS